MSRFESSENIEKFSLDDWLAWMESHHPRQIELGLDRIRTVAARLGIAPGGAKVITVGGTNGKGSCVAFLEQLLRAGGRRVGAYTSPHLLRYNERVRIDGQAVVDADLCAAFRAVYAALGDISLTYFEFGTLAALWLLQQQPLDVWVLEVGLGGRLDAVNLIDADVAVITTVDLDHQDWLGPDRESIGREKAGIFRRDRWAICVDPEPPRSVIEAASACGARWLGIDSGLAFARAGDTWQWSAPGIPGAQPFDDLPVPHLPLPSAAAALAALAALGCMPRATSVHEALLRTRLAGRFQQLDRDGVEIVLDVAHNPQAARGLARQLREQPVKRTLAVFELMQDKDAASIVEPLVAQFDGWFIGGLPDNPRAAEPAAVADVLRRHGAARLAVQATVTDALHAALHAARAGDRVVVFGSFFTVAAALDSLLQTSGNRGDD
jgi:dihydrofolate synthase/folylpolyglutamate synthase